MMENKRRLLKEKIKEVVLEVIREEELLVPIGVSNRHMHVTREDMDILFGKGCNLTKFKDLKQPGQYAAKETVKIFTQKGSIENVRILGPLRDKTQIEISITDSYKLGLRIPVRESGKLEGSSSIIIEGPKGRVEKSEGVIAALRHIHMPLSIANLYGFKDKEVVDVEVGEVRRTVLKNVLLRVSDKYALEMHLDTDEANSCGVKNGDMARILRAKGNGG